MRTRSVWTWVVVSTLGLGCAAGDAPDPDEHDGAPLSARAPDEPVDGNLIIEVVDASGRPVSVDDVTITNDGEAPSVATCFDKDEQGQCIAWIAEFSAVDHVTAWASHCGHRFGAPVLLSPDVSDVPLDLGVSVLAVSDLCPPIRTTPKDP